VLTFHNFPKVADLYHSGPFCSRYKRIHTHKHTYIHTRTHQSSTPLTPGAPFPPCPSHDQPTLHIHPLPTLLSTPYRYLRPLTREASLGNGNPITHTNRQLPKDHPQAIGTPINASKVRAEP